MRNSRKIINEKLNRIDHRLDVDKLWVEIENHLPPPRRKKKLVFWFWSLLGILLVAVGFTYIGNQLNQKLSPVDHSTNMIAAVESTSDSNIGKSRADKSAISKNEDTEKIENTKISGGTEHKNTHRNELEENSIAISKESKNNGDRDNIYKNQRNGAALLNEKTYYKSKENLSTQSKAPHDSDIPKMALSDRIVSALKEGHTQALNGNNVTHRNMVTYFPPLSQSFTSDLSTNSHIRDIRLSTASIFTKPIKQSKWEVSFAVTYGKVIGRNDQGLDPSYDLQGSSNRLNDQALTHVDILGLEANVSYMISHNIGLSVGMNLARYTDKQSTIQSLTTVSPQASIVEGYSLTTSLYEITSYNESDLVDVSISTFYKYNLGRWDIRPELGYMYNISLGRSSKDLENFQIGSPQKFSLSNKVFEERLSTAYFARLTLGYSLTQRFDISFGAKYLGATDVLENSLAEERTLRAAMVGQLGVRYRL